MIAEDSHLDFNKPDLKGKTPLVYSIDKQNANLSQNYLTFKMMVDKLGIEALDL